MDVKTIGIIGCGLMGSGIAEVAAKSGFQVLIREQNEQLLKKGLGRIESSLGRAVAKGKLSAEDKAAAQTRLSGAVGLDDALATCDLVVEAVTEDTGLKQGIFRALDAICPANTILASNTSSISVIDLAAVTRRPNQVLGMHFFNPVPVMPLLELVRTVQTDDATLDSARAVGERMGKKMIVAKDAPGFVVNRLLIPYLLDGIRVYEQGLASREDIDNGMMLGANHPMGPLTLTDFVGLDTTLFVADVLFAELGETRFKAPTLLRRLVSAGHLGRKSGRGFYQYGS
ncbi:3-hydroxybutyryl-CoA dehydrogenase [Candidatus Amarolinea dominans]|uniref:3-hydroxyacyl-CoA dehydrogenase family protein n=1 Tax=Candidatus Amarolinea dominans TaxID=3140696 RepID=UPI0031349F33|nr:3-hydroxybutyryl-CoA dehydrogenase [Anaerolineae bacterium]